MEKQRERENVMVFGTSLEVLEDKIKCFEDKQREQLIGINDIGVAIHFIPETTSYPSKISDETQLINFRFQLLFNRVKRLMDTEASMVEKLMLECSKNRSMYLKHQQSERRGSKGNKAESYELYELLNQASKDIKNLESLNSKANTRIKQQQEQIRVLSSKVESHDNITSQFKQQLSKWEAKEKQWSVQKSLLLLTQISNKERSQQHQVNMDKFKQKLIRSCVQKQNLEKEIVVLNQRVREGQEKMVQMDSQIKGRIERMKGELREELKQHVENLDMKETVSLKLFKKFVQRGINPV